MRTLVLAVLLPLAAIAQTPESPVPAAEPALTGWVDVGYRWRTNVAGSFETYRSIVNLGAGPKLFGAEFTLIDPKKRLFDQLHLRAQSWGDDPYGTFHLDARKATIYDFRADYRDLAYFNNLPSYADPLLARGIVLNQQSFDTRRHLGAFSLDLLPGNWLIPYLAYDRDSSSGSGVTTFTATSNEYAMPMFARDQTNLFRGGMHLEKRRFHATVEEGGTTFNSNESLYQNSGKLNPGNRNTPIFGQALDLTSLVATYGIHGNSTYTKALFTSNAFRWLDVYGQFLFSQPDSNVNYSESATGNFYLPSQMSFYQSEQYLVSASAKLPHTTGSFGLELRPVERIRITESWLTDRLHNSGASASGAQFLASSLASNYSQTETNVFWDATTKLTLRGGYRYVWGEVRDAVLPQQGLVGTERSKLRRNVGLGGLTYRPIQKLQLTAESEAASSGGVHFHTSLYDYQKVRTQARYQATDTLSLALDVIYLNNENPTPGLNYKFRSQSEALSFFWSPGAGKLFSVQGSYNWSALRSDILYLVPQTLLLQTSSYRENANTGTALVNVNLPHIGAHAPKLTAGGSFFISNGSRPTKYYQPMAKLWLPVSKHVQGFAEWWYYGYGEAFIPYEGFGTHLAAVGLRYTR